VGEVVDEAGEAREMVVVVVVRRKLDFESEFEGRCIMYAPEPWRVEWGT
jgi:hypothetical protein